MKFTTIGFPRIGEHRELKKVIESYWIGDSDEKTLLRTAQDLCRGQWRRLAEAGLSQIPVGDFSLYDLMLDTAVMVGAVPEAYRKLGLGQLDTYFAMARGYQGQAGDVRALTMKKWFNTNYHYMVPELFDDTQFRADATRLVETISWAKEEKIEARPVLIGPFTFLKLSRCKGTKTAKDFAESLASCYREILTQLEAAHEGWIEIDEPYLIRDLNAEDIELFTSLYREILEGRRSKVLLQTYFGDIRDCYEQVLKLPFDGIGLDFIEGKKTLELVEKKGLPAEKTLFAGLVNGKNIWRADLRKVLALISKIQEKAGEVVLSTSCSLLHVPYTVANETKLAGGLRERLSFAYEKLGELSCIAELAETSGYEADQRYIENQRLFEKAAGSGKSVAAALDEKDMGRKTPRSERRKAQDERLKLPLLPVTTIGSFPQTAELKRTRAKYHRGEISAQEYDSYIKSMIHECISFQESIGIDVLVHGEYERNDMVQFFGENLEGFAFTENAWVQSYGTRGVRPPIVCGDVSRRRAFSVDYIEYAASLTDKPVKGMLTGPVTILNWSFPREDISVKEQMYQIALALSDEVKDLEKAGISVIQIDEAAFREKLPIRREDWYEDYLDYAIPAFRLTCAKADDSTQIHTHMCYSEFEDIIEAIDAMDADVISFEASRSKLTIPGVLQEKGFETQVGPGVYDIHSPRVPSVEEMAEALRKMLEKIPARNLWVNPDCGLKTRGEAETKKSLENMVEAANQVRSSL